MEKLKLIIVLTLVQILFVGCYYDVEEELYPSIDCQVENMSLANDILPILNNDCMGCHSAAANFGNITLEGYDELTKYVNDGSLIGVVKHGAGFSPMPKGAAKLLDCEVEKIQSWIDDGALNN